MPDAEGSSTSIMSAPEQHIGRSKHSVTEGLLAWKTAQQATCPEHTRCAKGFRQSEARRRLPCGSVAAEGTSGPLWAFTKSVTSVLS